MQDNTKTIPAELNANCFNNRVFCKKNKIKMVKERIKKIISI